MCNVQMQRDKKKEEKYRVLSIITIITTTLFAPCHEKVIEFEHTLNIRDRDKI